MRKAFLLLSFLAIFYTFGNTQTTKVKKVIFQGFWWDYKNDNFPDGWANYLTELAPRLKTLGFDAIWIPPVYKNQYPNWVGYGPMDHYDLGDKFQKGAPTTKTGLGTKDELLRLIAVMHANGIEVIQDVVLNHVDGAGSGTGAGGVDPEPTYSMASNSGYKNFRYISYSTPAIDESVDDYWTRRGRWSKNYSNFHPNANNNCMTGDICHPYFGPDFDFSENSFGQSSNIPTTGVPTGYPSDRPYFNPTQYSNYMYYEATDWIIWFKRQTDADGFRWDAVKHYPDTVQRDLTRRLKYQISALHQGGPSMFNVGEWIGNKSDIDAYVDRMSNPSLGFGHEMHTGTFDFSLRAYGSGGSMFEMVTQNLTGGYDLSNIPGLQQDRRYHDYTTPSMRVHRTVPFVNSHDTFRPFLDTDGDYVAPLGDATGWDLSNELGGNGQHIDPREPRVAAAYAINFAMDGNPIVFFEDVFNIGTTGKRWDHMPGNTTDLPTWNDIENIIQCHQKLGFKDGDYKVRSADASAHFPSGSSANDHLVIERSGQAVIGINDQFSTEQEIWIDTDFAPGTILMDYSGANGPTTSTVHNDKRVYINTRPVGHPVPGVFGHGYSVWAPVPNNVPFANVAAMLAYLDYTPQLATNTTQIWEMADDLGDSHCQSLGQGGRTPDHSLNDRIVGKIFCEASTNVDYEVELTNIGKNVTLDFYDLSGVLIHSDTGNVVTFSGTFNNPTKRWITAKVRNTSDTYTGQRCFVQLTYTAPSDVDVSTFPQATTVSIWNSNGGSRDWTDCRNWEEGLVPTCSSTVVIPHVLDSMPSLASCFTGTLINKSGLTLRPKVFLQGPFNSATTDMNDGLRSGGHLPLTSPYSGGEMCSQSVLNATGTEAIIDWVLVELRDKTNPQTVVASLSGLLQKDGDVVDVDGSSPLFFLAVEEDDYHVVIRHRNHLGVMTANPISCGSSFVDINFTDNSIATYGTNALINVSGSWCMYAGNANGDIQINAVDNNLYWRPQNGQPFNYQTSIADFNLDGAVNAVDKNLYWRTNNSKVEQLP